MIRVRLEYSPGCLSNITKSWKQLYFNSYNIYQQSNIKRAFYIQGQNGNYVQCILKHQDDDPHIIQSLTPLTTHKLKSVT